MKGNIFKVKNRFNIYRNFIDINIGSLTIQDSSITDITMQHSDLSFMTLSQCKVTISNLRISKV